MPKNKVFGQAEGDARSNISLQVQLLSPLQIHLQRDAASRWGLEV